MGCWNETCLITNLPIYYGEECVFIRTTYKTDYRERQICVPVSLPIMGKYNDYGGLVEITNDFDIITKPFDEKSFDWHNTSNAFIKRSVYDAIMISNYRFMNNEYQYENMSLFDFHKDRLLKSKEKNIILCDGGYREYIRRRLYEYSMTPDHKILNYYIDLLENEIYIDLMAQLLTLNTFIDYTRKTWSTPLYGSQEGLSESMETFHKIYNDEYDRMKKEVDYDNEYDED